jgi:quercetin dioxygenase-like cupin family protein
MTKSLVLSTLPRIIAASGLLAMLYSCTPAARASAPVSAPTAPPVVTPVVAAAAKDSTPPTVNGVVVTGVTSNVMLERGVSGHLVSLNGRYKLRATMAIFEPGGYIGGHHHAGPGIRYVLAGELTSVEAGRTHIYHRGDWFYESGDTLSTVSNHGAQRDTILNFEILPADWYGPSTMPAPTPH